MFRVAIVLTGLLFLLSGSALAARIAGTPKNDVIRGTAKADLIIGKAGSDKLYGLAGNDTLVGGPGKDALVGGAGGGQLPWGAGRDIAVCDARDQGFPDCETVKRAGPPSLPVDQAPGVRGEPGA